MVSSDEQFPGERFAENVITEENKPKHIDFFNEGEKPL